MPVCGYMVYPRPGRQTAAVAELSALPQCTVYPAANHEVLVLVTDTSDDGAEQALQDELKGLANIDCIALSYAHADEATTEAGHATA